MKSYNPTSSAITYRGINKISHLANSRGASYDTESVAKLPLSERQTHRGELPIAVLICDRAGRGRAVYGG